MFLKLLIPFLIVSLFAVKSKQWDIQSNGSSPQWVAPAPYDSVPVQTSGQQNYMRPERNVNRNQAPNVNSYSPQTNLANSQHMMRSSTDHSKDLVDSKYSKQISYRGRNYTPIGGYSYGAANSYYPSYQSYGYPNQMNPNAPNTGLETPFIFGVFNSSGCAGKELADYTLHILLGEDLLCGRSNPNGQDYTSLISTKNDVKTANVINLIFQYQSQVQDMKTIGFFGVIISGNLQGNYIAVTLVFTRAQIMARCVPAMRTASISPSQASITLLSKFDPATFAQCDAQNSISNINCLNNLRAIALVECTGTVQVF